jgi:hypothetical protein
MRASTLGVANRLPSVPTTKTLSRHDPANAGILVGYVDDVRRSRRFHGLTTVQVPRRLRVGFVSIHSPTLSVAEEKRGVLNEPECVVPDLTQQGSNLGRSDFFHSFAQARPFISYAQ